MEVGEYVRTKYGIAKITKIDLNVNACEIDKQLNDFHFVLNENIIRTSPKIIDLIQVGDYVNGYLVKDILDNGPNGLVVQTTIDYLYEKDIKSIVTREMFESMEYKIGE